MFTKRTLKDFFEEISEGVKFEKFDHVSPEKFHVLFKCKVNENEPYAYYEDYAKNWINRFSRFTSTGWIVRNCYGELKRLVFRKTFACHRAAQNKSTTALHTRNSHCKASIDFRVKFINKHTSRNDPLLNDGLNMNIAIAFEHSHLVRDRDSFRLLSCSQDSKSLFYEYFDDGYSRMAAKCYHRLRLVEEYGPGHEMLANASLNPKLPHIAYIYKNRNQKEINLNEVIIRKIEKLEKMGHTIRYSEAPPFVVILTPLMKRVITQIGVRRVLVDATLETGAPLTLFLYVPSFIGSLPIASVILTEPTEAITYLQIFLTIKMAVEGDSNLNFAPELLVQDNPNIKQALMTVFPNAVIKSNRHSLCRDIRRWFVSNSIFPKGEIHHTLVHTMMLFKSLIFANSLEEAVLIHDNIILNYSNTMHMHSWLGKLEEIWQDRLNWIDDNRLYEGFSDAPVFFKKEFILQVCYPFTAILPAMVDVVTNVMESHYRKMLLSHKAGDVTSEYTKYLAKVLPDPEKLRKVGKNDYILQCSLNKAGYNMLNTDTMCCDCKDGQNARMCAHLCGVLNTIGHKFVLFYALNNYDQNRYTKILRDDKCTTKYENEAAVHDERSMPSSSKENDENCDLEIKEELVPLEQNHHDTRVVYTSHEECQEELKEQYEGSMKSVNDEFKRLNKLFKENPNRTNLCTMQRLASELAKIDVGSRS